SRAEAQGPGRPTAPCATRRARAPARMRPRPPLASALPRAPLAAGSEILSVPAAQAATPQSVTSANAGDFHPNEDRVVQGRGTCWLEDGSEVDARGRGRRRRPRRLRGLRPDRGGGARDPRRAPGSLPWGRRGRARRRVRRPGGPDRRCLELEPPSGACVCLCVVSGDRVVVANVGDCRAVALSFDGEGCALSVDQRCGEGPEYARIVEAGGAVVGNAVEGLMPARTVGDADVKRLCPPRVILAEPEVRAWEGRGVVVLATDGVWDVVGSEEALELIPYKGRALRRECRDPGASCARSRARIGAGPPWPAGSHLFPKDIFAS
ncbi:unnamed protein product, partial [Prorocentrum cordatum]